MTEQGLRYRLAPGVDVVAMGEDAVLFRSTTLAVRIDGPLAVALGQRVIPHLDVARSVEELTNLAEGLPADTLQRGLDSLVTSRVLERVGGNGHAESEHPLRAFIAEFGVDPSEALERLRGLHVAIFGLEGPGAHLALELARLGVKRLTLADPHPPSPRDALLMPIGAPATSTRQDSVKAAVKSINPNVDVVPGGVLSREAVGSLVADASLAIACFDRGFETAQHWVNRAAIGHGVPALFAELRAQAYTVGPYVIPRQTACYMCYRMRRIAVEQNYEEAMAYERYLNERRVPSLSSRANATFLAPQVGSLLVGEVVKVAALGLAPTLAGRILEGDCLTLETAFHTILRAPDCPVCGAEPPSPRLNPPLDGLRQERLEGVHGDLRQLHDVLVSDRTGVITHVATFAKDPVEPAIPYIVRADIANHRFLAKSDHDDDVSSGKGMTLDDARVSAMGEAVERYSAGVHWPGEITRARRADLNTRSIDPRDLVLYAASQYERLPYAPYLDESTLGWVRARSLVHNDEVMVPALAVFMNYHAERNEEFLHPITSNGLAAGPTLLDAVWHATSEVLERDAFMITWLQMLPARQYRALEHPHRDIVQLAELYARRGVDLRLYRLRVDHEVAVFAGVAVEEDPERTGGPSVVMGLGADVDPVIAARKAALEVGQVRPALRRRMREPRSKARLAELLADPTQVATIDDHDLLYADASRLTTLRFLLEAPTARYDEPSTGARDAESALTAFVDWLRSRKLDLLYVNLTPPDMAALGLYTARALLPGFQPIDFGWQERRLAGRRLFTLPEALGLPVRTVDALNALPHPLA